MRRSLVVNGQRGVLRVRRIYTLSRCPQAFAQPGSEVSSCWGELERLAIRRYTWRTLVPWQQLLPVIGVRRRALDIHITAPQAMVKIMEHADFKLTWVKDGLQCAGCESGLASVRSRSRVKFHRVGGLA